MELRIDCPNKNCPNPRNHFYIEKETGKAFCQRCNISFSSWTSLSKYLDKDILLQKSNYEINSIKKKETIKTTLLSYEAQKYLWSRGVTSFNIKDYDIKEGVDEWNDYIIFTCFNTGYQFGRSFKEKRYRYPRKISQGKTFYTSRTFWGDPKKDISTHWKGVIVEGVFDVIAVNNTGDYGAIGILGTMITKEQEIALRNMNELIVWLDPDAQGEKQEKIIKRMQRWGIDTKGIRSDKEPGDCNKDEVRKILGGIK